ncbi:MAG TPA: hypothetical protein VL093_07135 [Flavipsychrobacter sp.]|nr:hypothetical protein [Flavipsychrobacter sp.]
MDVAKYIGLFLLKNHFVYIHGLGNLEIRKKPASYNGEVLEGPSYDVIVTSMGSIDDNLANFIATNEQISISKASNSLREFSLQARADLQAGKPVIIPSIGSFVEENGKIIFITDPHFHYTPPSIASVRIARRQDETVYTTNADIPAVKPRYIDPEVEDEGRRSISWAKMAAWIVGLIIITVLVVLGIRYMNSHNNTDVTPLIQTPVQDTATPAAVAPVDTTAAVVDSSAAVSVGSNGLLTFDVVINTYTDLNKAQRRLDKLKSYGNNVELITEEDSSVFYVTMPIEKIAPADTARLLDSLKRVFNPTYGVKILE